MTLPNYLRYPDVHGERVAFVAENDVWLAPVGGGRAWRLSGQGLPARNPRFAPDGKTVAWTVLRDGAAEVVAADTEGGNYRQLTHWGHPSTRNRSFTPGGEAVAITSQGQGDSRLTWAHTVPLDGTPGTVLRYGPVDTVAWGPAVGDEKPLVLGSALSREPAHWKRYRGGTAGKLWIDRDGGGGFERLAPELDGSLCDPVWIGARIAFLSDHEGYGNIYSVAADGGSLRRHTDHGRYYARHLASDGTRLVYESAGRLHILDGLDAPARVLDMALGSAGHARQPQPLDVARHLQAAIPDRQGHASVVESHGTLHLLVHRQGPARAIEAAPGVRARLGTMLDPRHAAYVADHAGREAVHIRDIEAIPGGAPPGGTGVVCTGVPDAHDGPAGDRAHAAGTGGAAARRAAPGSAEPGTADTEGMRRFDLPAGARVRSLEPSPDGKWLAIATEYGQVYLLEPATAAWHLLADSGHGAVADLAFSPDSGWLAWADPVSAFGERSRLLLAATAQPDAGPLEATDGRFRDHSPSFTPDGRYLAFLSERSFDPLYDTHGFDLSFPASTKPYLLALADTTASLYGPAVYAGTDQASAALTGVPGDGAAVGASSETGDLANRQDRADAGSALDVSTTHVVAEGLPARIFAVPVVQGRYESLVAVEGGLLWLADVSTGVTGDGRAPEAKPEAKRLERFDHERRETTTLVDEATAFRCSADRKRLVFVHDDRLRAAPTDKPAESDAPDARDIDLDRIRVRLDPGKVWAQAFDEAWRLQRDFFWVQDMGGLDWDQVAVNYRPLIERIGSHDDLVDVLWEMHGELGTSHAYVTPAEAPGRARQGLLGADLERVDGQWRIAKVLQGESSDPQAYSPLAAPGVAVRSGDTLLAVDGVPVPSEHGPAPLLQDAGGRIVELTVRGGEASSQPGSVRRVSVVPIRDEQRLRYQEWVAENRATVRQGSDSAFGYLHVPDMMPLGWAQLYRDLDAETEKDALVIDVRRNRGGHTSQLVAEIISRRVAAWSVSRGMAPWTYPSSAPRGPVVVLADEWAGSDGDIITQVAKLRGIGPVIGTRTWGGVIGIDGLFDLADGTRVTQPRYATWFIDGVGWGVENHGVDPDIEVPFPPHAYVTGDDPQLEQAVAILKELLREAPTRRPPETAGYRSLRPGPLPGRPQDLPGSR